MIWRAAGAWRDVLACRRHFTPAARETAAFGLRGLGDDLRHSARAIRRSPGFTVAAVASLSIGIAATTTVFSAVNALLFRSLPGVRDSGRLAHVYTTAPWLPRGAPLSPEASYQHYREALTSLFQPRRLCDGQRRDRDGSGAEGQRRRRLVTPEYFAICSGSRRRRGGCSIPRPAPSAVAVAGHDFAVREFGTAGAAVGRTVTVNGVALEVIGVTPRGFIGVRARGLGEGARRPQLWFARALRPLVMPRREQLMNRSAAGPDGSWLEIVGRLAPGVSMDHAIAAGGQRAAASERQPRRGRTARR